MRRRTHNRGWMETAAAGLMAAACVPVLAQSKPAVLDRVVAVVNNRAILSSDVENEMQLAALEPQQGEAGQPTEQDALQELISRALIQQQIRQEDAQALDPSKEDVAARVAELRKEMPACVRLHCTSDLGWREFLSKHGLTQAQVETYVFLRLEILAFIEERFRQGIRIPQEDVEKYYRDTLVPQYAKGEAIPPLKQVQPRIQEILLQQHVNVLFGAWLENLRKQGDVEVLDPALEPAGASQGGNGASQ